MTQFQSRVTSGLLLVFTGIIIALLSYNPSRTIQYVLAAGIFLSGIFAFITATKNKNTEIPLKYHRWLGAGMFVYALAILIYASTFEKFITITLVFLLYFGITEILFGFQLMAYKRNISLSLVVLRMITGFFMAVGAVVIFTIAFQNKNTALLMAGILILLSGINFILFANATRKLAV